MGSGEEERGGVSEAFTDSADGSSSSSDAASTEDWPALALAPKKTTACGVPDAEMNGRLKRRAGPGTRASHLSAIRGEVSLEKQCRRWC